jgi:carbonic anhydrase/acetyltransferase-like protein (isoleucine patch superfamily)
MPNPDRIFLAPNVVVCGKVLLAPGVNLWFGTVIRGDIATITLKENVNIQDHCVLHTDFDVDLTIDEGVVAGHSVVLHGSHIGRDCLIGIGARVLSGTDIGEESIVAAGSVVTEGKVFPPRSLLMGIPARIVRQVTDEEVEKTRRINRRYREMAEQYAQGQIAWPYGKPSFDRE